MTNEIGNLCIKYGTYIFDSLFKDINNIKGKLVIKYGTYILSKED